MVNIFSSHPINNECFGKVSQGCSVFMHLMIHGFTRHHGQRMLLYMMSIDYFQLVSFIFSSLIHVRVNRLLTECDIWIIRVTVYSTKEKICLLKMGTLLIRKEVKMKSNKKKIIEADGSDRSQFLTDTEIKALFDSSFQGNRTMV
jgi:hypothetical protein